jgi:hypothetical protein
MTAELIKFNTYLCCFLKPSFDNLRIDIVSRCLLFFFEIFGIRTRALNESVQSHCSDLNRDEITLSHQPFNSGYECSSIKSSARSSNTFKIKFDYRFMAKARVVMWPIGEFNLLLFNRCTG